MRRNRLSMMCAAALLALAAGCVPCFADESTGKTKLATQEWVRKLVERSGIRVTYANFTTNITTEGGVTVTNYVFTSPFSDTNFPGIVSISLAFSAPRIVTGTAPVRGPRLLSAGSGSPSISITLTEGLLLDGSGKGFKFADGWDMEWTDFPEAPPDGHVCELDTNCNCKEKDNTEESVMDDMPSKYKELTTEEIAKKWPDPSAFYPDWGSEDWQITRTLGGNEVKFVTAYDPEGVREQPFRVADIGHTDAWLDAMIYLGKAWNDQMLEWQIQYVEAHVCNQENPQHNWKTSTCGSYTWKECRRNSAHKEGTEQHQYPGSTSTEEGHSCECGERMQDHSFGSATIVSQTAWIVRYRKTCVICAYAVEWEEDNSPCRNGHVPLTDACGCACGYFSPTNNIAADERFHHFTAGGSNGNPACLCDCGHKHRFKVISQYEANRFPAYTNCTQCLGICWECKERDVNGNIVPASAHTAFTTSEARGAARCGCRCGKVTASDEGDSRFHYRNATGVGGLPTCRCYGANAKASGASPGSYHYYSPSACPKVCSVEWQGKRHLTTTSVFPENTAWTAIAAVTDHEKKDTGTTCGCKCGYYNNTNWRDWNGKADFHRVYNSCCCGCPAQHHIPITRDGCTLLCGGNCTGLYEDKTWRQSAGALFEEKYHFPSETACACKCNYFHGSSAPKKFHAVTNAVNSCFCECKTYHKFYHARNDCLKICSTHGDYDHLAGVDPAQWAQASDHSFEPNSCFCKCPAHVLHPDGHRFAPDECDSCYCGQTSRSHKMKTSGAETTSTYTCESCGNTITIHVQPLECERCGFTDSSSWESGHDPGCGTAPKLMVTCPIHNFQFEGPTEEAHDGFGPRFWGTDNAVLGKWTKTSNWTYISLNHELSENLDEWFDILYFPVFVAGDVVCPKCMEAVRKKEETSGGGTSGTGGGGGSGGLGGLTDI